jgi:hypothetical protein
VEINEMEDKRKIQRINETEFFFKKINKIENHLAAVCWWLMPIILATCQAEIRRIKVQSQPRLLVCKSTCLKITKAKWIRGVAQVVECLLCKFEVLSSSPKKGGKKTH